VVPVFSSFKESRTYKKEGILMNVMEVSEEALRAKLRMESAEFQQLEQEHRKIDKELMNFEIHVYLSTEEEIERRRLQKLKLATKDKMMEMLRRAKAGNA
jgi:uncharacterized protein YdcH (DUF465 family)